MLYNAKNGTLKIGDTTMDYIRFGSGERILVMLPGLGDGLRSMKGTALPMAFMYRVFTKEFTVYAFSRKNVLPVGYTTRDMARDQAEAMERLGISAGETCCIGDRIYTDIRCGLNAGITTMLVLSGEVTRADLNASEIKPHFVLEDAGEILAALQ